MDGDLKMYHSFSLSSTHKKITVIEIETISYNDNNNNNNNNNNNMYVLEQNPSPTHATIFTLNAKLTTNSEVTVEQSYGQHIMNWSAHKNKDLHQVKVLSSLHQAF